MSRRPDAEEAAHLQYETEHTRAGNKSVLPYMAILVTVAFLLLLMAYFMQRRTAESVEGLNQSADSFRTIDQLVEENRALREDVVRLQKELDTAQKNQSRLESDLAAVQAQLDQANGALAQFVQPEPSEAP